MRNKNGQKLAWQSIRQVYSSKDASKHKRCMAMILLQLPQLSQSEWEKRCSQLYRTDSVEGPEAVAWGLQIMAMLHPPGAGRVTILEQMDKARNDAAIMKQIRKGWQEFGVDDPWWVVHDKPVRQMARYNSEPVFKIQSQPCRTRDQ